MPALLRFILLPFLLVIQTARLGAQDDPVSRRAAIDAMYPVMMNALEAKNYGRARNICDQAIIWEPQNPVHHYNLACIEARAGGARIPHALSALELSVALGFDDVSHMQNDADLVSLRDEPRYQAVVKKLIATTGIGFKPADTPDARAAGSAGARAPVAKAGPGAPSPSESTATAGPASEPVVAAFREGVPVGLYFMTRFWASNGSLEKSAWYFAPDGNVYQNLEHGFSREDLAAHTGRQGRATLNGSDLVVTWTDGKPTKSKLQRDTTGFKWSAGIFTPVVPFAHAAEIAGTYEGGESLGGGANGVAVSKQLELRADGSFEWQGIAFTGTAGERTRVTTGSTRGSTGRWELAGFSLKLTDASGRVLRRIVFPNDDQATPLKPDRMFFGGLYTNDGDARGRSPLSNSTIIRPGSAG